MADDPHHVEAETHHHATTEEATDAKAAVVAAAAAVAAADKKMDGIVEMLGRHFRLGVVAVGAAVILGLLLLSLLNGVKVLLNVTQLQVQKNEIEVLRHKVHEREGHLRLCSIALGARLGAEEAARVCAPVLGGDYKILVKELEREERSYQEEAR